ncbi:MAG: hydrogenase expression/formation protein HypE [bacterium]
MKGEQQYQIQCPIPHSEDETILLSHGGGGRLTRKLIEKTFLPYFFNPYLAPLNDGAVIELDGKRLAFTTDSFVVQPLSFPGGDIGKLAINGTINDLAMCGAKPLYLSAGFIIEEGFPVNQLEAILSSMQQAAQEAEVSIITGDTKVVQRGKGDGIFINTSGIGLMITNQIISPQSVQPGDAIILSGDIGRHSIAVLIARGELGLESPIESDCAPLHQPVLALLEKGLPIHCLRDLTRGGLATALVEIARSAQLSIKIDEKAIPIQPEVYSLCEVLGYDPLYLANEGCMVVFVPSSVASEALEILHQFPVSRGAVVIGEVIEDSKGWVVLKTVIGSERLLEMLSGEQLPRIC